MLINKNRCHTSGVDPGFKDRGRCLKKLRRAKGGAKSFGSISCEKSRPCTCILELTNICFYLNTCSVQYTIKNIQFINYMYTCGKKNWGASVNLLKQ